MSATLSKTTEQSFFENASLRTYLDILRRRKIWILAATIGLFIFAAVLANRLPDIYRAGTTVLVDPQQVPDKIVPMTVGANIADRLTTLQEQVLSPTRLKTLVENQHLYPDPSGNKSEEEVIKSVQKSISVELANPGGAKMAAFSITYSSRDRLLVAPMANQIAQMFINYNQNARIVQTEQTRDFIQGQLEDTKRQLDEKESQLRAIKTRNVLDLPESRPFHLEALANLRGQIQGIQDKIAQDQREKSILQSVLASGNAAAPTVDVQGDGAAGTGRSSTEVQVGRLEAKLSELRVHYGPNHPDVRRTQEDLNKLKAKAALEAQNPSKAEAQKPAMDSSLVRRRNPVIEAQIENLEEDVRNQQRLLPDLQSKMEFHTSKLEQIPVFEQQIAGLQRDYDVLKTQYTGLLDKKLAADMSNAMEINEKGERFVILDAAVTPRKPAAPPRSLISLAGLFGGLLAGIGLALVIEMNDESVRSENEASLILSKPVLSGIPHIISRKERLSRRWQVTSILCATAAGSFVLGLALSFLSGRLL